MFYWTFLIISHVAPFEGKVSILPYRTEAECGAAIDVMISALPQGYSHMVCEQTDIPSGSIRPKARPAK